MKEKETSNSENQNNQPPNDEIDLRELFYLIKKGIENVRKGFLSLLIIVFKFLRKNLIYLLLGALLGLGIAIFNYANFSSQKIYKMIVSPNDISRIFLYDKIKYYNKNKTDSSYIILIEPIKDYKESTEILFNKLGTDNKEALEKIKFENYLASIKDFEYRNHVITIYSNEEVNTDKAQKKIVSEVENSSLIMKKQKEELEVLYAEKKRIESNLENIDKTIKNKLEAKKKESSTEGGVSIQSVSEADVFKAYQELSNKLSEIERQIDNQKETLQVLSDLSFIGETRFSDDLSRLKPKKLSTALSFIKFILFGLFLTLVLILGLNILKYFLKKSA